MTMVLIIIYDIARKLFQLVKVIIRKLTYPSAIL